MPKKDMIFLITVSANADSALTRLVSWVTEQVTALVMKSGRSDSSLAVYDGQGRRRAVVIAGDDIEVPPAAIPVSWDQPSPF